MYPNPWDFFASDLVRECGWMCWWHSYMHVWLWLLTLFLVFMFDLNKLTVFSDLRIFSPESDFLKICIKESSPTPLTKNYGEIQMHLRGSQIVSCHHILILPLFSEMIMYSCWIWPQWTLVWVWEWVRDRDALLWCFDALLSSALSPEDKKDMLRQGGCVCVWMCARTRVCVCVSVWMHLIYLINVYLIF